MGIGISVLSVIINQNPNLLSYQYQKELRSTSVTILLANVHHYYPGIKPENLHSKLLNYKKKGMVPKWLVPSAEGTKGHKIKVKEFEEWLSLDQRIVLYGSTKLYWIFKALGHSDNAISKIIANRSQYFKDSASWNGFFTRTLFANSDNKYFRAFVQPTMGSEFVRIGTRHIYLLMKSGKLKIRDKGIFDE